MFRASKLATQTRSLATLRSKANQITSKELYEPIFKSDRVYPDFPVLNVRLQGYDFVPLERYQSYVHRVAKKFGFTIVDSYAVSAQTERITTYKPNSTLVDSEIELAKYDRTVRLADVPSIRLPIFLTLLKTHAPVGVEITVKEHEKADEDSRYIPDLLLREKQEELKALDDPAIRRNLGWE
uniref:Ribosomal_S10 domain-containing protein n=1 Tax=Panagrellus redivivus TaxID=6233 RepID=A0A7E4ZXS5_PANRE